MMLEALVLLTGLTLGSDSALHAELAPPVRIEAAGKPIDTGGLGHAAPCVADIDGDGIQDLLVGQFSGGSLWVYRNEGTNAQPKLAAGVKFKDGMEGGCVPYG